jgi:hypothetical protein
MMFGNRGTLVTARLDQRKLTTNALSDYRPYALPERGGGAGALRLAPRRRHLLHPPLRAQVGHPLPVGQSRHVL